MHWLTVTTGMSKIIVNLRQETGKLSKQAHFLIACSMLSTAARLAEDPEEAGEHRDSPPPQVLQDTTDGREAGDPC